MASGLTELPALGAGPSIQRAEIRAPSRKHEYIYGSHCYYFLRLLYTYSRPLPPRSPVEMLTNRHLVKEDPPAPNKGMTWGKEVRAKEQVNEGGR